MSDLQDDIAIADKKISGELKYVDSGALATDWGAGYFLALKFDDFDENATSIKVGLTPSQGSGLVELINDPDKNGVFKITDKDKQKFTVVTSNSKGRNTDFYTLKGLEFEEIPTV